ncbi:DNA cytosine methyltransferase [Geodermatophilus sp. SYSU D01119]
MEPLPVASGRSEPVTEVGTSVELFTGGGGLAMAMHRAGFRHLLVNEFNHRACSTLRSNLAVDYAEAAPLPTTLDDPWPLVEGDVRGVDFSRLEGQVDIVAGGVPCQPFSLGGAHRGHMDERNMWPELLRCVRETRPRVIVAENVKGLLRPSFDPYWQYILREIEAPFEERVEGEAWQDHDKRLVKAQRTAAEDDADRYDVHFKLVNAADYGVPQVRWRVFIVAFRRDLGVTWGFPAPTHSAASLVAAQADGSYWDEHGLAHRHPVFTTPVTGSLDLPRWRTLRDAIGDLPEPVERQETQGYAHHVGWPGARTYPGHTPNSLDKPAKTVKAGVHGVPGGESVLLRDDGSIRYLTVREVARIMTFPDSWTLDGPRGEQMRQLGNAVPVELAHAILGSVATAATPTLRAASR